MYSHLKERERRLLCLLAVLWNDEIQCHLEAVSLDDCPVYEALSYTWDEPPSYGPVMETLYISGRSFELRTTVKRVLCRLRCSTRPRILWIDSLCIYSDRTRIKTRRNLRLGEPLFRRGLISVPDQEMCSPHFEMENT